MSPPPTVYVDTVGEATSRAAASASRASDAFARDPNETIRLLDEATGYLRLARDLAVKANTGSTS